MNLILLELNTVLYSRIQQLAISLSFSIALIVDCLQLTCFSCFNKSLRFIFLHRVFFVFKSMTTTTTVDFSHSLFFSSLDSFDKLTTSINLKFIAKQFCFSSLRFSTVNCIFAVLFYFIIPILNSSCFDVVFMFHCTCCHCISNETQVSLCSKRSSMSL